MRKYLHSAAMAAALLLAAVPAFGADSVSANLEYNQLFDVNANFTHTFDEGTTVGGNIESSFGTHHELSGTMFSASLGQTADVSIFHAYGYGSLGADFTQLRNFGYYEGVAGLDTHITDSLTWNTAKFRYRAGFNSSDLLQTERLQTGLTLNVLPGVDVSAGFFHDFHSWDFSTASFKENDGVVVGISRTL